MNYIISITAQDRAGMVAGISEAMYNLGGNILAASQTVHQGYFAMIILGSFSSETDQDEIRSQIKYCAGSDLHVFLTSYNTPEKTISDDVQSYIVTALGPDKPGILYHVSHYLASKDINIDDLYAYVDGKDFVVICQVSVPSTADIFMLQADLQAVGESMGLTIHMQHENVFVVTNELTVGSIR